MYGNSSDLWLNEIRESRNQIASGVVTIYQVIQEAKEALDSPFFSKVEKERCFDILMASEEAVDNGDIALAICYFEDFVDSIGDE